MNNQKDWAIFASIMKQLSAVNWLRINFTALTFNSWKTLNNKIRNGSVLG